jgi:hypothetical protein
LATSPGIDQQTERREHGCRHRGVTGGVA